MLDEFHRLLAGAAPFTADLNFPKQLHGYVLRSPHAHATICAIETAPALARNDVVAILTAGDLEAAGVGSMPCVYPVEKADGSPMVSPPNIALADGRVRHVGDAVAFIVATSREAAETAAEDIDVDYDVRPSVTDARSAMAPGAAEIWSEAPDNVCFNCVFGNREATEAAFKQADHTVKRRLTFPRIVVNTIETRAALAVPNGQSITLYTQSQGAQYLRGLLATALGWSQDDLHVVTPNVGGAFGIRGLPYPEQVLVAHSARALGRPVKWVGERTTDGFLGDNQARDQSFDVELALDKSGHFLGIRMQTVANLGAKLSGYAPINSTLVRRLPGPYDIAAGYAEVSAVFTNTVQVDAYRGAGRAELVYPLERIVDAAARELGMDAAEIRRRNFAKSDNATRANCFDVEVENRDYRASFERALAATDWESRVSATEDLRRSGRCRGIGMATYAVPAMGDVERVVLSVDASGDVSVFTGTQSSGQGHHSVFARIVAEELSIDVNRVRVLQGDTRQFESDSMTAGSRTIPAGVPACRKAASALLKRGRQLTAELIQSEPDDISYADGIFRSLTTDAEFAFGDLVVASTDAGLSSKDDDRSLCVEATHNPGDFTAPCGTHVCEVEIDQATGQVRLVRYTAIDDIGAVADQALASAQIHGGVAQGLGQALLERSAYDEENGQLLNGSIMDYVLPRADDLPNVSTIFMERNHSDRLHGVGEMGTIASTPAIINAVMNALRGIGAEEIDAPLTTEKIWRACRAV